MPTDRDHLMHLGDHSTRNIIRQRDHSGLLFSNQLRKHSSEYFQLTFTTNYLIKSKTDHLSL
ncbi:hypothetical protein CMUS01_15810 [Colletotrichum musicola]|uniref:Uncharacterized protein n=1 Tax=Colletotrichum musicola TaxID=2175873 RepID=A0A8H6MLM5_9PEZI|nr:hypothetical protein CMUS01_15810 [Colletotrichum musicola]